MKKKTMSRTVETASDDHQSLAATVRRHRRALTAQQIADLLACSAKSIYAMAAAGRIPSLKIGSMLRFDPILTAAWLEAREQTS
jgi:excisionase family DNA binding protein